MAKKTADETTIKLIQEIQRRKDEIKDAERSNYKTNCSFAYEEGSAKTVNLNVESSVSNLVKIAAFVRGKASLYASLAVELKVDAPKFTWQGFSEEDWIHDIKLRIGKVQIAATKKKLEVLEARAQSVISPELRTQLELEAIERELNN